MQATAHYLRLQSLKPRSQHVNWTSRPMQLRDAFKRVGVTTRYPQNGRGHSHRNTFSEIKSLVKFRSCAVNRPYLTVSISSWLPRMMPRGLPDCGHENVSLSAILASCRSDLHRHETVAPPLISARNRTFARSPGHLPLVRVTI